MWCVARRAQLFYNVRRNDFVTEFANFENLGNALITLFRCSTGESFNGIMHDLTAEFWGDNVRRCCWTWRECSERRRLESGWSG